MADNTENKSENNNVPDFGNVLRNLFDQVRTQSEAHRRRVRIHEEKRNNSEDEEKKDSDEDSEDQDHDGEHHDGEHHKWDILQDLADSQRILCRAFVALMNNSDEE